MSNTQSHRAMAMPESVDRRQVHQELLQETDLRTSEFLSLLGHEMRNPLASIMNAAQALQILGNQESGAQEMVAIIQRQSGHLSRLLDDVLDVSRIACGKLRLNLADLDLCQIIANSCAELRPQVYEKSMVLRTVLPAHRIWVRGDQVRLSQIVAHLISNAVTSNRMGGEIQVQLAEKGDETCVLTVTDRGEGMAPETIAALFTTDGRTGARRDRSGGGLGISLVLVKGLTELHGGQVAATSAGPGQGSQFFLRFPTIPAPQVNERLTSDSGEPLPSYRILVIDDRRDVSYPLQTFLSRLGHQVETVDNGTDGLKVLKTFSPHLVLCDIGLPGISGYDVARAIRADPAHSQIFLVAVTGYGQESDRRQAAEAGFDQHLTKPIGMPALKTLLDTLAQRQCSHHTPRL